VAILAITLQIGLSVLGIALNLIGTVLLIFSLPATVMFREGSLVVWTPDSGLKSTINLFRERVFKDKNQTIVLSLILLIGGVLLQIASLFAP
jgi:hypothetical protein